MMFFAKRKSARHKLSNLLAEEKYQNGVVPSLRRACNKRKKSLAICRKSSNFAPK